MKCLKCGVLSLVPLLSLFGCDDASKETVDGAALEQNWHEPGALVEVTMRSQVGVVLNEIPRAWRDAAAQYYLGRPQEFWKTRAAAQVDHTSYRLVYRNFFYDESLDKGILALPPHRLWKVQLGPRGPRRTVTRRGVDAIVVDYRWSATLLSDPRSPAVAEPALGRVGGVWEEPYELPLDPEFLFQRTGYACMDEDGYPLRTVESENAGVLYDHTCDVETADEPVCHYTEYPAVSCLEALDQRTGRVTTKLRFERIRYDNSIASAVRVADYTNTSGPDLEAIPEGLDNHRIVYRYFEANSCALAEGCVTGTGWRRLLEYDASIKNTSPVALTVGKVSDQSPFVQHNVFEYSACHEHYHYTHYGDFRYGQLPGEKRAFCIESTDRYFNSEQTPLTHPYGCDNQGIASGWGDTYIAGVECNWIDITDLDVPGTGTTQALEFKLNPDGFICEGSPVTDADGGQLFTPTTEVGENGGIVDRPLCQFVPNYAANNVAERNVTVPREGGLITSACTRSQAGPLRDCGWTQLAENLACAPGTQVHLRCRVAPNQPAQVLRICEHSAALGSVIACMYHDALASAVVGSTWTQVRFTCPEARSAEEPGGGYGQFGAGLLPTDASAEVECRVVQ